MDTIDQQSCNDPPKNHDHLNRRSYPSRRLLKRQTTVSPGYVTTDDFGTDGDDTLHSAILNFPHPNDVQANASFPTNGTLPEKVDLVFFDFLASWILNALKTVGADYSTKDVLQYMPPDFTTNTYFTEYAKMAWQKNMPNCPVGEGVGS